MNSKQILLKIPALKEENKTKNLQEYRLFEKYVGTKNYRNLVLNDKINFLEKNTPRLGFILKKINDKDFRAMIYSKLKAVFNELINPFLTEETEYLNIGDIAIKQNLDSFFEIQKQYNTISNVSAILNFHTTFLNYFGVYFTPLVSKENIYIHQEIYSISSSLYTENPKILQFAEQYINKYDVEFIRKHKQQVNITDQRDEQILELLKNIFNNLIKKLQKRTFSTKNKDYHILTYGSYTTFKINPEIKYNDIDMYHNNPLSLLVSFLIVIKLTLNIDVDIFRIPFVIGHISLRYKKEHFADCLYMDDKTITEVPSVSIKEIIFVHPILQILNFFRLMSELRRMTVLSETQEKRTNTIKKMAALLQYCCEAYSIDIENDLEPVDFNITSLQETFVINLEDVFKKIPGYDNIKEHLEFDYLVIVRYAPPLFLKFLKDKNPIVRKQWFALFNEIVVEFHNKKPLNIVNNKKKKDKKLNKVLIRESNLVFEKKSKLEPSNDITHLIENNNLLLMSNFTTEFYMKVSKEKNGLIKKNEMTNITKETCLSSFVLSQVLNCFENEDLVKFYFTFLLSYIKNNNIRDDKQKELILLANQTADNDIYITSLGKNKLEGKHETFYLTPYPRLKNLFFYKKQEERVYHNYQNFLDVTMYN